MNDRFFKDIGAMDRLITIRKYSSRTNNRFGHMSGGTYTDTELYAARSYVGKNETDISDKDVLMLIEKYIIRDEITGLSVKDEAFIDGTKYDIINLETIGRNKFIKLTLKKAA